jgi:hypothetical protein
LVFEKFEILKVWDPNLKVESSKLLGSQGLGVSEVGRSENLMIYLSAGAHLN